MRRRKRRRSGATHGGSFFTKIKRAVNKQKSKKASNRQAIYCDNVEVSVEYFDPSDYVMFKEVQ